MKLADLIRESSFLSEPPQKRLRILAVDRTAIKGALQEGPRSYKSLKGLTDVLRERGHSVDRLGRMPTSVAGYDVVVLHPTFEDYGAAATLQAQNARIPWVVYSGFGTHHDATILPEFEDVVRAQTGEYAYEGSDNLCFTKVIEMLAEQHR